MRVVVISTLSLLAATVTQAQGRREISLPDTLGARFSLADSATKSGTPADYDFLIGLWHFRFQTRAPNGAFNEGFTGHWTFKTKPDGGHPDLPLSP